MIPSSPAGRRAPRSRIVDNRAVRALICVVIAGCGWSSAAEKPTVRPRPARIPERQVKPLLDPIEALAPSDDDEVAWSPDKAPEVRAPDGDQLWPLLQAVLDADEGSGHPTSAS